jgi:hypothetical protein
VDDGAVVALVVVLGDDLPVRRYLVVVAGARHELLGTVVLYQLPEVAYVLPERGSVAAGVREEPAVPLDDAERHERVTVSVEARELPEPRSACEGPVEPVRPRVVRAADELLVGPAARLEELMPAVAAHVVEGVQPSFFVAGEEGRLEADRDSALVARAPQVLRAPHTDPGPVEKVIQLPPEHRLRRVSFGGEGAALAEWGQSRSERFPSNRRHGGPTPLVFAVMDHIY